MQNLESERPRVKTESPLINSEERARLDYLFKEAKIETDEDYKELAKNFKEQE